MKHKEITRLQNAGELSLLDIKLYEYLAHHADARNATGKINRILVKRAARDLNCTRQAIHKCASKLRGLGLLAGGGEEGDNCLAGFLPHIAVLTARAKPSRKQSVAAVAKPQTDTERRAVERIPARAKPKAQRAREPIPSQNGKGTVAIGELLSDLRAKLDDG